ncbi:PREDICTED: histone H2A-beta, sperm-like [Thamnophis sirtalis]|uniref:Histone H2A n=1 Tax=Thamnophis sirtalis TaxID=35019 RepID=A0A6I9YSF5_9SAUR|nr:PREDICTED: histone H2A-beta, sperm-like [Thamnophis sirtalis]
MSDDQCDTESFEDLEPEPSYRRGRRKPKTSRSCRAGLIFPVSRIDRFLRKGDYAERMGSGASVYMTAVLQYLTYDLVDIAGNIAMGDGRRRIAPGHLRQAVSNDSELQSVFGGVLTEETTCPRNSPATSSRKGKKSSKGLRAPKAIVA